MITKEKLEAARAQAQAVMDRQGKDALVGVRAEAVLEFLAVQEHALELYRLHTNPSHPDDFRREVAKMLDAVARTIGEFDT